jgi:hypothetical protein
MPNSTASTETANQAQQTPAPRKPWWHSRTIWFNAICTGLGAAELSLGLLQPMLPVNSYAVLSFVLVVGNTVLRSITGAPLALRQSTGDR